MRNGDSATPISGALANALAAAANAAYQVSTFWVVARFQPLPGTTRPFNVQAPFASEEEALAAAGLVVASDLASG